MPSQPESSFSTGQPSGAERISPRRWMLLPMETKVREFDAKLLLAGFALRAGYGVILGHKTAIGKHLEHLPRGFFLDLRLGSSKLSKVKDCAALGYALGCLDEEGLLVHNPELYADNRVSEAALNEVQRYFAWGEYHAEIVRNCFPAAQCKLIVTGNPRVDLWRPELRGAYRDDVDRLRREHGRYILMSSNFGGANHFLGEKGGVHFARTEGRVRTARDEAAYVASGEGRRRMFQRFRNVVPALSARFPDLTFIVRPHPSENHESWHEFMADLPNVKVIHRDSPTPWILGADAIIHSRCTTGLEAYLLGVPAIAFEPSELDVPGASLPNDLSTLATSDDQLLDYAAMAIAGELPANDSTRAALVRRYISALDGPLASERIIAAVDELDLPAASFQVARKSQEAAADQPPAQTLGSRLISWASKGLRISRASERVRPLEERSVLVADDPKKSQPLRHAYMRQKFPGCDSAEALSTLAELNRAYWRDERRINAAEIAPNLLCLTAGP